MRIKVNVLDPQSIENSIKGLNFYSKTLELKASEVLGLLAERGKEIVDYSYSLSDEDCEVSCVVNGNSSMIIAEGQNVMFLEFGTGVYTDDFSDEMETKGLPPIFAGSYSQTEGRGHFRPDHQYWYYNRVMYQGTLPTRGFYFASKDIKEQAVEIAKKVFKK